MGSNLIVPELTLDVKPSFIPKSISDFLSELTRIGSISEKIRKIDDFVGRLEDEMRKIDAFKRELPLCVIIVNDAILALKEELAKWRKRNAEPILAEFIPLNKKCAVDEKIIESSIEDDKKEKMNWMSSVQLWSTNDSNDSENDSCFNQKKESLPNLIKGKEVSIGSCENTGNSRAFLSFKEKRGMSAAGLSLVSPRIDFCDFNLRDNVCGGIPSAASNSQSDSRVVPRQQSGRKQRRCWSPELHRLFVDALEKLGGSQVATPKQIRDLMRVDGLTNDEVKSHLQKYRLHTRRVPTSKATSSSNQSSIDLGGLWPQKDHCGESSKQSSTSQSLSPPSPFQFSKNGVGIEEEDDEYNGDDGEGLNRKIG